MVHSELECEWRCEGCGDNGVYDPESMDILTPIHHCPLIKGPFDIIPKIHIAPKE